MHKQISGVLYYTEPLKTCVRRVPSREWGVIQGDYKQRAIVLVGAIRQRRLTGFSGNLARPAMGVGCMRNTILNLQRMAELQDHSCGCCVAWKRVYFGGMSAMADQYQITDPSRSKDEYCRFCNKICLTQNRIYLIKVLRRYLPRFRYVRNHDTNRKGAGFPAPPQTPLTWRQKQ